jgi:hypothetical protein
MRAPSPAGAVREVARQIDAAIDAVAIDAAVDAPIDAMPIDAAPVIDARITRAPLDAGPRRPHEPPPDATITPPPAPPPPPDASPPDAPSGPGHIVVANDVWCNVWIDALNRGSRRNEPIEVPAGHHTVRCENPSLGDWVREVDVAPGATISVTGALLRQITVKLDIDATIGGRAYPRGAVAPLWPGSLEVVAGGKTRFITFRENCTLRESPELGCYR